jgi:flagellar basal-body rod protein FlgF
MPNSILTRLDCPRTVGAAAEPDRLTVSRTPGPGDTEVRRVFLLVRGLYTSAAGALVAQANIDVIANNLANASTSGFKRALLQIEAQPDIDLSRYQTDPGQLGDNRTPGVPTETPIGQIGSGSQVYATPVNFEQGQIVLNGNTLSFALAGPGFFALRNATTNQATYTRNGSFMRGADGNLRNLEGDLVLDPNGNAIPLPTTGKIEVDKLGNINVDGATSGRIGVVEFNNVQALTPLGSTQYGNTNNAAGVIGASRSTVYQYSQEQSNGDVVHSMVDLIANQRWFEANEKSISTQDDATSQSISAVGRTTSS